MIQSMIDAYPCVRGKVRDTYDIGDNKLVVVTTDRLSAFDVILPNTIPQRGRVLTKLTKWWGDRLSVPNAILSDVQADMPTPFRMKAFEGRVLLVQKCKMYPFECVARGFLSGSAWGEYKATGHVAKLPLPPGLPESVPLIPPLFTPATKSEKGHDVNISFAQMKEQCPLDADNLKGLTLNIFKEAQEIAFSRGLYIADTKFEFGNSVDGSDETLLCDEIITPDSSRFWPVETYRTGPNVPCLDKQRVRQHLKVNWLVYGPEPGTQPPELPGFLIEEVSRSYLQVLYQLTGDSLTD